MTMARITERAGMPITNNLARQNLIGMSQQGDAAQRALAVDLISTMIVRLQQNPPQPPPPAPGAAAPATDPIPQVISELTEALRKATFDTDANVRAWATFLTAFISPQPEQQAAIEKFTGASDWQSRLFGVLLAQLTHQGIDQIKPLAEGDDDEIVEQLARGVVERFEAAATQPATAPAPAPAK